MKIGLVVYSQTGNTKSVAEKMQEKLQAQGHDVTLAPIQVLGEYKPGAKQIVFQNLPNLDSFEAFVFASPVQAFSLASVMAVYLAQMASVQGKKTACFVTQHFSKPWLGGNRAIRQMQTALVKKGATLAGSGVVNWSNPSRDQMITDLIENAGAWF